MARCSSCNKFAAYEEMEPEVQDLNVDLDGVVTAEVRIVNSCADCGEELTEATLTMEEDRGDDVKHRCKNTDNAMNLSIEETSSERTVRFAGSGRLKTFYGARVSYTIECSCGRLKLAGEVEGEEQASGMVVMGW